MMQDCAQACVNDRGCVSFEIGTDGVHKEDCLLSYDTPKSVAASGAFVKSPAWDYYEMKQKRASPTDFFAPTQNKLLTGQDTAGTYINITVQACAQRCLHRTGCKSFDYGGRTALCADSASAGFVNKQTRKPYSCAALANFGFCLDQTTHYAPAIRQACPSSCSTYLGNCYSAFGKCVDDINFRCAVVAATGGCTGNDVTARTNRYRCPSSCRAVLQGQAPPDFRDELCKDVIGECMLSTYASGDSASDLTGAPLVALQTKPGWVYYEKQKTTSSSTTRVCGAGTASPSGRQPGTTTGCAACPANTYANKIQTKCEDCPAGYTAASGSASVFDCKRGAVSAHDPSKYFQVGETWTGSYWCGGDKGSEWVNQGHGRLELYVVGREADGSLTVQRSFQNTYTSGSYYMTAPAAPELHESFALTYGQWTDRPADRVLDQGKLVVTTNRTSLSGNVSLMSDGKVSYHGDFCGNGSFSLTRACTVSSEPTFVAGEHWIGSYRCVDGDDSQRFDVRRLDLVIDDVNGSHVKVHSKLEHQDSEGTQGSFRLKGDLASSNRLHLVADSKNAWIRKPGGTKTWYTSDLNGYVTSDHLVFKGTKNDDPSCACTSPCLLLPWLNTGKRGFQCDTHEACPNAQLVQGKHTVFCDSSVQLCSQFEVNRVCTPHDKDSSNDDPCSCTGQVDSLGRGGTCASRSDDTSSRGAWCHVDSECILAGPDDDKHPDRVVGPEDGGVAKSGLWWATCLIENAVPCVFTPWVAGECTWQAADCTTQAPVGTVTSTRRVGTPASNGGTCTGDLSKTEKCTPSQCTVEIETTVAATTQATTQAPTTARVTTAAATTTQAPAATTVQATAAVTAAATTVAATTAAVTTEQPAAASTTAQIATDSVTLPLTTPEVVTAVVKYFPVIVVLPTDFNSCCTPEVANDFADKIADAIADQAKITKPVVQFAPGSVVVTILTANEAEQAAVTKLAGVCSLCFDIKDDKLCAHLQANTACTTTTTTTTSTTTTSTTTTTTTVAIPTTAPVSACPLTCLNGGKCTLIKQDCADPNAAYDLPVCDCGATAASACFYGAQCESKITCPQAAQTCNPFVPQGRGGVDASQICSNAAWAPGVCSSNQPAAKQTTATPAPPPATTVQQATQERPACDLKCTNGGTCVLAKDESVCDDDGVPRTIKTCLCPYAQGSSGTSCYFGRLCASKQVCPPSTRSCNAQAADGASQPNDPLGICSTASKPNTCYDKNIPLFTSGAMTGDKPDTGFSANSKDDDDKTMAVTLGIVVAAIILLILIVLVIVYLNSNRNKDGPSDDVLMGYTNPMYGDLAAPPLAKGNGAGAGGVSNPMYNTSGGGHSLDVRSGSVRNGAYGSASAEDPAYAELPVSHHTDTDAGYAEFPEDLEGDVMLGHNEGHYSTIGAFGGRPAYVDVRPNPPGDGEGEGYLDIQHDDTEGGGNALYDHAQSADVHDPTGYNTSQDAMYDQVGASWADTVVDATYDSAGKGTSYDHGGTYDTASAIPQGGRSDYDVAGADGGYRDVVPTPDSNTGNDSNYALASVDAGGYQELEPNADGSLNLNN